MTQREVARRLGLSRPTVQWIEREALRKVAIALDLAPRPHASSYVRHRTNERRCTACGELGHNRRGCTEAQ